MEEDVPSSSSGFVRRILSFSRSVDDDCWGAAWMSAPVDVVVVVVVVVIFSIIVEESLQTLSLYSVRNKENQEND
jgi:hypothetical protein